MPNPRYNLRVTTTVFLVSERGEGVWEAQVERLLALVEGVLGVWIEGERVCVQHDAELASVEALQIRLDHLGLVTTVA